MSLQRVKSLQTHELWPTRLLCLWDFPGKNTGVGCHFLLQCMKVKSDSEVAQSCLTLSDLVDCSLPGFSVHGIFQAQVLEWGAIAFSVSTVRIFLKTCNIYDYTVKFIDIEEKVSNIYQVPTMCHACTKYSSQIPYDDKNHSYFKQIQKE